MPDKMPPLTKPKWKAQGLAKMNAQILADLMTDIAKISPVLASLLLARPIDEQPKRRAKRARR